jgi:hypothetical protein
VRATADERWLVVLHFSWRHEDRHNAPSNDIVILIAPVHVPFHTGIGEASGSVVLTGSDSWSASPDGGRGRWCSLLHILPTATLCQQAGSFVQRQVSNILFLPRAPEIILSALAGGSPLTRHLGT